MKTIYTAIFGGYEELKDPLVVTPGWSYICYTDRPQPQSKVWSIVLLQHNEETDRIWCRFLKLTPSLLGLTIWVDGSFTINCNLDDFVDKHSGEFVTFKHPLRQCAYEEAQYCIQHGRGNATDIQAQVSRYAELGLPVNAGLISSGILIRRTSERVMRFCYAWLEQVELFSNRDQIAFTFVNWKNPGVTTCYPFDYRTSKEFIYKKHEYKN